MRRAGRPPSELVTVVVALLGARSAASLLGWARTRSPGAVRPIATRWRHASVVLACAVAAACWDGPTSTLEPIPVVSLTLVEGDSLQVASVTITTPGDSVVPVLAVPVAAGSVDLEIEDDSGQVWSLAPTTTLGKFTAAMSPRRGARYQLRGSVTGRAIAVDTRAPTVFALTTPAADTITAADTAACNGHHPGLCVPYAVVAEDGLAVTFAVTNSAHEREYVFADQGQVYWITRSDDVRDLFAIARVSAGRPEARWLGNRREVLVTFGVNLVVRRKLYIP